MAPVLLLCSRLLAVVAEVCTCASFNFGTSLSTISVRPPEWADTQIFILFTFAFFDQLNIVNFFLVAH